MEFLYAVFMLVVEMKSFCSSIIGLEMNVYKSLKANLDKFAVIA